MMDFDELDYVYHPTNGVGRVQAITEGEYPDLIIDFKHQKSFQISEKLAFSSLLRVTQDSFRALEYDDPIEAQNLLIDSPAKVLAYVLRDFPNSQAKTEDIRAYLSPYVADWSVWWENAKSQLKDAPFIDTSESKMRIYGLRDEAYSAAEEAFSRFQILRRKDEWRDTYEQAKRVLLAIKDGKAISDSNSQILKDYFLHITRRGKFGADNQIDALFRLFDVNLLTLAEAREKLRSIIAGDIKIFTLGQYSRTRTMHFLLKFAETEDEIQCLLSGLCGPEETIKKVIAWLLKRGDPERLEQALLIALSHNIPPELPLTSEKDLSARLAVLPRVVEHLNSIDELWPTRIQTLHGFIEQSIDSIRENPDEQYPYAELINVCGVLYERLYLEAPLLTADYVNGILRPEYPSRYFIKVFSARNRETISELFTSAIDSYVIHNIEQYTDDFLIYLYSLSDADPETNIRKLVKVAVDYMDEETTLLERIGEKVVQNLQGLEEVLLPGLANDLENLVELGANQSWLEPVNAFRERAYFLALAMETDKQQSEERLESVGGFIDPVMQSSIQMFIDQKIETAQDNLKYAHDTNRELNARINDLEQQLGERNQVLRELRSTVGGGGQQARFDERARILRELSRSVAELERFAFAQGDTSDAVKGMLIRLTSLLKRHQVIPMQEDLGSHIEFDPKNCQLAGEAKVELSAGELVLLVERGYEIQDPQGIIRPLKPAVVQKFRTV